MWGGGGGGFRIFRAGWPSIFKNDVSSIVEGELVAGEAGCREGTGVSSPPGMRWGGRRPFSLRD